MGNKKDPDFIFVEGPTCFLCGQSDRPVAANIPETDKDPSKSGICEVCAVRLYWDFKSQVGDVPPGLDSTRQRKISKVKVLVPKLRNGTNGSPLEPAFVDSYEFAMVQNGKHWDLPTEEFDTDEIITAYKALDKASLVSWKWCIEPLYRGYTPRGGLVSVVLATAYAKKNPDAKIEFRSWPIEDHVDPGLSGLYFAMSDVWSLRIYKWSKLMKPTGGVSVLVREATREYIRLKLALKKSSEGADTSMLDYYRKTMTPDEKYICELCLGGEKIDGELLIQQPKTETKPIKPIQQIKEENVEEEKQDLLNEFEQSDEDDGEGEVPDGFVRQGNVLSTETE